MAPMEVLFLAILAGLAGVMAIAAGLFCSRSPGGHRAGLVVES